MRKFEAIISEVRIGSNAGGPLEQLPQDLSILRKKIKQQRNTVEALKRGGHECADAERQLKQMLAELQARTKNIAHIKLDPFSAF